MNKIYELGYKIAVHAMNNWKFGASPDEFGESISYNIHLLNALKNGEMLSTEDWVDDEVEDTVTLRSAKLEAVAFCVAEPAYLETDSYASFRKRNIDLEKLQVKRYQNH